MQIYKSSVPTESILAYDIFHLLGLDALGEEEKVEYQKKIDSLALDYFLQEKISEKFTGVELAQLMRKYPPDKTENIDALFSELGERIPDVANVFMQSISEVKAHLVEEHYVSLKANLLKLLEKFKDDTEKSEKLMAKIGICEKNLLYIDSGKWEFVNTD